MLDTNIWPLWLLKWDWDLHKPTWSKRLRLLGLSDPDKWLRDAQAVMDSPHNVRDVLRHTKWNINDILWTWWSFENSWVFSSSTLLLNDSHSDSETLTWYWFEDRVPPILQKWYGYRFSHGFVSNNDSTKVLSAVMIDERAINELQYNEWITESEFRNFEKSLWALFSYANHDYTMHGMWLVTSDTPEKINDFISSNFYPEAKSGAIKWEILSWMFHKDVIAELWDSWHPIFQSIEKHSRIVLNVINKITDVQLRRYWLQVLKYPLFSLIGLKSEEKNINLDMAFNWWNISKEYIKAIFFKNMYLEDKNYRSRKSKHYDESDILSRLKRDYPNIDLSYSKWWSDMTPTQVTFCWVEFPMRSFRKHLMQALREDNLWIFMKYILENWVDKEDISFPESFYRILLHHIQESNQNYI